MMACSVRVMLLARLMNRYCVPCFVVDEVVVTLLEIENRPGRLTDANAAGQTTKHLTVCRSDFTVFAHPSEMQSSIHTVHTRISPLAAQHVTQRSVRYQNHGVLVRFTFGRQKPVR
jgi:hypothetical protein